MKKILIITLLASFLTACGGSANSANSANSNVSNSVNANSANNQTTSTNNEPPVTMDYEAFGKTDSATLESYKGRTMIVKGGDVRQWDEDVMVVSPKPDKFVRCKGTFGQYADAIKLWRQRMDKNQFDYITADVKGVVKEVESRSETTVTLENCTLLKLDK